MAYGYKKYSKTMSKKNAGIKKSFKKSMPGYSFKGASRSLLRPISTPRSYAAALARGQVQGPRPEIKAVDIPVALYPMFNSPTTNTLVTLLNGVQEGTGFYNRIGRHISMKSLHVTGTFAKSGNNSVGDDYVRWAIVYDRQPSANASLPTYQDIFKAYDQGGAATAGVLSGVNLDNRERFVILRDFRTYMPFVAAAAQFPTELAVRDNERNTIDEFIKLKGLETHYNNSANPIQPANISTGSLLLVTQGLFAVGQDPWAVRLQFRLRYSD